MLMFGLVGLVPAVLAARLLPELRIRVTVARIHQRTRLPRWSVIAVLSSIAAASVACFPAAAGNGMDARIAVGIGERLPIGVRDEDA